jgi:1,4-alpha-glucan branching enzyme
MGSDSARKTLGAITPLNTLARKHLSHNRLRPADAGNADMTKLKTLRAVNFLLQAPTARSVSLVGDFNGWDPTKHPMTQGFDKSWSITLELKHGHHRYAFLVDGVLSLDPRAQGVTRNDRNERVSLLPVS